MSSINIKHNDTWKQPTIYVKHNDSIKQPNKVYVKQDGSWVEVYSSNQFKRKDITEVFHGSTSQTVYPKICLNLRYEHLNDYNLQNIVQHEPQYYYFRGCRIDPMTLGSNVNLHNYSLIWDCGYCIGEITGQNVSSFFKYFGER